MESSTATHGPQGSSAQANELEPSATSSTTPRARHRGAVLARGLFAADAIAAVGASAIAVGVLGLISFAGLGFVACATLVWPLAAFSIGLYRSDQLATWASAVTEVPRAIVAIDADHLAALRHRLRRCRSASVVALTFITVGRHSRC